MATYLITGSSRGIGYTLVQHLLKNNDIKTIIATARSRASSPQLLKLIEDHPDKVHFVELDVATEESAKNAVSHVESILKGNGLDVLINNAGVMPTTPGNINGMTGTSLTDVFTTNVLGVHYVTQAFLPLLRKGSSKKIINISTTVGSIAMAAKFAQGPYPEYKITKAALNMLTVQYALSLADDGFTVIALSPGWIKTDLGSQYADLTPDEGASAVLDIVYNVKKEDSGKFLNVKVAGWEENPGLNQYPGGESPW